MTNFGKKTLKQEIQKFIIPFPKIETEANIPAQWGSNIFLMKRLSAYIMKLAGEIYIAVEMIFLKDTFLERPKRFPLIKRRKVSAIRRPINEELMAPDTLNPKYKRMKAERSLIVSSKETDMACNPNSSLACKNPLSTDKINILNQQRQTIQI